MEVQFRDSEYKQLERDPHFCSNWAAALVKAYRNRLNFLRQALDERDFYAWKSLRFERLKGNRDHQFFIAPE